MIQQDKPLLAMAVPHLGASSTPGCCTFLPAPANESEHAAEDDSRASAPEVHMGDQHGATGS